MWLGFVALRSCFDPALGQDPVTLQEQVQGLEVAIKGAKFLICMLGVMSQVHVSLLEIPRSRGKQGMNSVGPYERCLGEATLIHMARFLRMVNT